MTISSPRGSADTLTGYRHELYPYRGRQEFLDGTLGFIKEALDGDEAVVVAVPHDKVTLLRAELPELSAVRFVDTGSVAHHPGRLIAAWQQWIGEHTAKGRPVRGIGESPWDAARSRAEVRELQYYEWLLNKAFARSPAWWLLCPYDADAVYADLKAMARCHPEVRRDGRSQASDAYDAAAAYQFEPLDDPCNPYEETRYAAGDLAAVRGRIAECARRHGIGGSRLRELTLAATEIAGNSIKHGGGHGVLRTWAEEDRMICEFHDRGYLDDPLVGRTGPDATQVGGRGLWLAHHLCDLVEIRSTREEGTTVRLHTALPD
ncbi:anti-sigma factor RsbA family regulatory protein [Streptomyces sp. NPDC006259]|uniref:anti-sigma factor RsbA family regulatory protein n=1 Tax=Streptomyces sp. NPDC006259 TaxID=3364740 RepID=UPI003697D291